MNINVEPKKNSYIQARENTVERISRQYKHFGGDIVSNTHRSDLEEVHCTNNYCNERESYQYANPSRSTSCTVCEYSLREDVATSKSTRQPAKEVWNANSH